MLFINTSNVARLSCFKAIWLISCWGYDTLLSITFNFIPKNFKSFISVYNSISEKRSQAWIEFNVHFLSLKFDLFIISLEVLISSLISLSVSKVVIKLSIIYKLDNICEATDESYVENWCLMINYTFIIIWNVKPKISGPISIFFR